MMVHSRPRSPLVPMSPVPRRSNSSLSILSSSSELSVGSITEDGDQSSAYSSPGSGTVPPGFGHPLRRMVVLDAYQDTSGTASPASALISASSSVTSFTLHLDYEAIVDDLLKEDPDAAVHYHDMIIVEPTSPDAQDTMMIKPILMTSNSQELAILKYLNQHELRRDPWNPVPKILHVVTRGDCHFVCFERLFEHNTPPFRTVANCIDFIRQCLEGLTFLHEHHISHLCYTPERSSTIKMALEPGSIPDKFDRTRLPVRYFHTQFYYSVWRRPGPGEGGSNHPHCAAEDNTGKSWFAKDVKECGAMIHKILHEIHVGARLSTKFAALTNAMAGGEFTADDSRKLFEALCKTLDAGIFDAPLDNN